MSRQGQASPRPGTGLRIAALHGWDVQHGGRPCDPAALLAEGLTLLALDAPAIAICLRGGHAFTTVEDWVLGSGQTIDDLAPSAESSGAGWWQHDPGSLAVGAVVWPERDHWQEPIVWVTALIAVRLASALRDAGVSELRIAAGHPFDPSAPDRLPGGLTAAVMLRLLPDVTRTVPLPGPPLLQRARELVSGSPVGGALRSLRRARELRRLRSAAGRLRDRLDRDRLTLLMLPKRELDRSGPIVARLADHLSDAIIAVPWEDAPSITALAGELNDVPWLPTPSLARGSRGSEAELRRDVDRNLAAHPLGELEPVREELRDELHRLADRWAAYASRLTQTVRLLRALDPALVVVGRDDVRYQIPAEAAASLGIPTLSLPHSLVEWSPPGRLRTSRHAIHLGGIENPTAPPGAILRCSEAFVTYQYPQRVEDVDTAALTGSGLTVLILTDGFGAVNRPTPGLRWFEEALRALADAVEPLGPDHRILLKPHPGTAEDERLVVDALGLQRITVLPRTADLIQLLRSSDLVVGIDTVSSSLVHAVLAGIPIMRLSMHADGWAALRSERPWRDFWSRAVLSLGDGTALAQALLRFAESPDFRIELRQRSDAVAEQLRPTAPTPSLAEVVDELIATGAIGRRERRRGPRAARHHATRRPPAMR